jgi:GNAT superfamily N-acetyltransferase
MNIRRYDPPDEAPIVQLSLRAWAPVFASIRRVLGDEIFEILHPDWREDQAREVRKVLSGSSNSVWVAATEGAAIGFVAATVHPDGLMGEVVMLAVDPDQQRRGVGAALLECATEWLRSSGVRIAVVETGGDPGHAPARRTYDRASYTPLPIVRYFRAL